MIIGLAVSSCCIRKTDRADEGKQMYLTRRMDGLLQIPVAKALKVASYQLKAM
jgi:hypothetical protein